MKKDKRLQEYEFGYKGHRQTEAERIRELEDTVKKLQAKLDSIEWIIIDELPRDYPFGW